MSSSWYYIDDHGNQQGPFTMCKIQKWYKKGLLPSSLLLTQTPKDINSYLTLSELELVKDTKGNKSTNNKNAFTAPTEKWTAGNNAGVTSSGTIASVVGDTSTKLLRSQILQTQLEISLTRLQHVTNSLIQRSLEEENKYLLDRDLDSNLQLLVDLTLLNRPTEENV